ncbi:MAG: S-methyl-5-thioribose-1-phosphate isomerase [Anaerovoracaceae bacterium]
MARIKPVIYEGEKLLILDQRKLPQVEEYIEINTKEELWEAIHKLKVRGAPAIGIAAAFGIFVITRNYEDKGFAEKFKEVKEYLETSRPTAVNLFWALDRMYQCVLSLGEEIDRNRILDEAKAIFCEDENASIKMGEFGLSLLKPGMGILTHCNAGALATSGYGTCLAPLYLGHEKDYEFKVFADETRPLLQGARLTTYELNKAGIDVTLICDNMAATVMSQGKIDAVVVGCDRMAANGDGANKIGTNGVAILAKHFGIPFYMYVPSSTIDLDTETGKDIEIEYRDGEEIYSMWYQEQMAPKGINTINPSFDVTNHELITAIITEKGIVYPPYNVNLREALNE